MRFFPKVFLRRFGKIAVLAVIAFLVTVGTEALLRVFTIQTIEVVSSNIGVEIDTETFPKNLLFFPVDRVTSEILAAYPYLSTVEIRKKYPSTLVLSVATRVPIAVLVATERTVVLDRAGMVLGFDTAGGHLPRIIMDVGDLHIGAVIGDARLHQALAFLSLMPTDMVTVNEITIMDSASLRVKSQQTDIYIPQDGDLTSRVTTLQTLTSGFRIKGLMPRVIDLRFDKPVITW